MAEEKVYTPEVIEETPYPQGTSELVGSEKSSPASGDVYAPAITQSSTVRTQRIATQLLSTALNTKSKKILQEFELEQSGGLRIGNYQNGETGEVLITPNGITAKDIAGLISFALDALTGSAVFRGSIQAGTLITGAVAVGDSNILIDGETRRMIFYDENGIPAILIGNV
jgi:hypothetical protein